MKGINKFIKYALFMCLSLILFTPLLISGDFLFPYITLKTIYLRILIEIALFLYVLLALSDKNFRPKISKLMWLIFIFGGVVLITGLIGVNPYRSFWGTMERGEGWLTISHLIAFAFILSQVLKTKKEWLWFLSIEVLVSVLVGIYAILPRLGVEWAMGSDGRLASTLGNAAYLGAYMLGNVWLSTLLFFERKNVVWKIVFAIVALFDIYILLQSETRGAILSFAALLVLVSIMFAIFSKSRKIKISFLVLFLVLAIGSVFVWMNKDRDYIKESKPLHRIVNISFEDITTQSRLYAWDSSYKAWKDRLIFGYGWENYQIAFNKYFHPEIYRDAGSQIWFDRAHNTLFDVAVASGLIGLISYLAIFVYAWFFVIKKGLSDRTYFNICIWTGAFLAAHFLQNIFVFDSHATYIMMFAMFGFVGAIENGFDSQKESNEVKDLNLWFLLFGGLGLIVCIWYFNVLPAKANVYGLEGMKNLYQGSLDDSVDYFQKGINSNTYQSPELRSKFLEGLMNISSKVNNAEVMNKYYNIAILGIKKNIVASPKDTRNYLYLMTTYNIISEPSKVLELGNKALELSPTRPQIYFEIGKAYISLRNYEEGIANFEKAVALNPKTTDSHWNLLTAYILSGKYEEAEKEYQTIVDLGVEENNETLERLLRLYSFTTNYQKTIDIYDKLIQSNPREAKYYIQLMEFYKKIGDSISMQKIADFLVEQNPDLKEQIDNFINN